VVDSVLAEKPDFFSQLEREVYVLRLLKRNLVVEDVW